MILSHPQRTMLSQLLAVLDHIHKTMCTLHQQKTSMKPCQPQNAEIKPHRAQETLVKPCPNSKN